MERIMDNYDLVKAIDRCVAIIEGTPKAAERYDMLNNHLDGLLAEQLKRTQNDPPKDN